jgi:hypothetical protein
MQSINKAISNWFLNTWQPTFFQLGLARILYCLGFFIIGLPEFGVISGREIVFFDPPPGISKVIGPITSEIFWWVFDLLVRISFVSLLFGYRTKFSSLSFGLLMVFGFSYLFSYGKIDHVIYAVIFPLIMAFSNWGGALSVDAANRNKPSSQSPGGWTLAYLSLLLGWGYFTAGLPKLLGGWMDPENSATAGFLIKKYYTGEENLYLVDFFATLDNLFIYKMLDYGTLVFELGFIIAIISPRWCLRAIGIAAGFHLGVLLTLNIPFTLHVLVFLPFIMYYFFEKDADLTKNLANFFEKHRKFFVGAGVLIGALVIFGFYPEALRNLRTHSVLIIICFFALLMVIPKKMPKKIKSEKAPTLKPAH